jgi:hypothetical protein
VARSYLTAASLPPRPDPVTGLPRPPHAPWFLGGDTPYREDPDRESDPAQAPKPPPGQGPVLVWFRPSRRGALWSAGLFGLMVAVAITVTRSIDWVEIWGVWLIIVLGMALIYVIQRGTSFSAGAEWLAAQRTWVRTYELLVAKARASGTGVYIQLEDAGGRKLEYKFTDLGGSDRLLFDLTYNGILHSVIAGGAETNALLHRTLKLPYPASARHEGGSDHRN